MNVPPAVESPLLSRMTPKPDGSFAPKGSAVVGRRRGGWLAGWAALVFGLMGAKTNLTAGPVQVFEEANSITLKNDLVTAVIDKKKAEVTSITLNGARNLLSPKGVTFDAEAFGPGKTQTGLHGGDYKIVSNGPEQAEVVFFDPSFVIMSAEMHLVMRRDDAGIYEYLVMKHGPGQPAGSIGQLRWVFRGQPGALTHAFASATKHGQMIADVPGAQTIADATVRLPKDSAYHEPTGHTSDGFPVYSKYDWTDYSEEHVVHGFSSDREGIWMVQPSMEYYNGGPTKGVLTVHGGPVSILEFLGGHFLIREHTGVELAADQEWQQIVGPWFVYLNRGANAEELWRDAYQRGLEEKAAWPYSWVQETPELYPQLRGTVTGSLLVPNEKTAHALVVLGTPDKDWQTQSMRYLFWARADAAGRFTIPKVRPGSYALYASVPGVVGELKITDVKVAPGETNDLGTVRWNPPRQARLLWRLGTPNRSTAEFRFGGEMRQFGLWWRYLQEMGTRELNYVVGQSQPAKNWYYAQSVVAMEDGSYFSPKWNIRFNLPTVETGKLRLTVDLAGAAGGDNQLVVSANGQDIGEIRSPNDSGVYRSAVQSANFRHHVLEFDASVLHSGENTLSLVLRSRGNWRRGGAQSIITTEAGKRPEVPSSSVMYDCVQLEAGPTVGDGSYQVVAAAAPGPGQPAVVAGAAPAPRSKAVLTESVVVPRPHGNATMERGTPVEIIARSGEAVTVRMNGTQEFVVRPNQLR